MHSTGKLSREKSSQGLTTYVICISAKLQWVEITSNPQAFLSFHQTQNLRLTTIPYSMFTCMYLVVTTQHRALHSNYDSLVTESEEGLASIVMSGSHGQEQGVMVVEDGMRGGQRLQQVQQLPQPLAPLTLTS